MDNIYKFHTLSKLSDHILSKIITTNSKITIALSGGSTIPPILKELLPIIDKNKELQKLITWTWIDERLVPYQDAGSNYGSVKDLFSPTDNCIPLPNSYFPEIDKQYQGKLASSVIDFLLLGFGDDGHIASIFPNAPYQSQENDNWIFRSSASYHPKERWTWSMPALLQSKNTFVLFKSGNKRKVLEDILSNNDKDTPLAYFLSNNKGNKEFLEFE